MPLLKGGDMGMYGTAPIVHAAAYLLDSGESEGEDPVMLLEARLCAKVVTVLPGIGDKAMRFINSHISCPGCPMR